MALFLGIALPMLLIWEITTEQRGRLLWEAASTNNIITAEMLVLLGTDVNYNFGSGTALHMAAYNGNIKLMKFLIYHGAIVDCAAKFGVTPLYEAHENHQREAEQFLLAHGANADMSQINPP